ncbi:hypothetical protein F2P79_002880 [Pimephales promelas]|nr:hypothetical protein F2P79_002880 [Pimephales promelas]
MLHGGLLLSWRIYQARARSFHCRGDRRSCQGREVTLYGGGRNPCRNPTFQRRLNRCGRGGENTFFFTSWLPQ